MRGTIIAVPCNGARITTPLNGPPTLDRLTAALSGGSVEIVPGFDTIEYEGKAVHCVAFCDPESKLRNQPINFDATIMWDAALLRAGYPGLLKPNGRMADMLFGQITVLLGARNLWRPRHEPCPFDSRPSRENALVGSMLVCWE